MIVQHYPIEPRALYGGEYPGDRNPDVARARLMELVSKGVRTFLDLTTLADGLAPYDHLLEELAEETGWTLRRISLPVRDMDVPSSADAMRSILNVVRHGVEGNPAVYIHCWGGIGRTGTVVGCWLRECGMDPDAALARVQELYSSHMPKVRFHPESPQTPAQRKYVRNWQPGK
jgi:protein tyrosine/serine phosphatase